MHEYGQNIHAVLSTVKGFDGINVYTWGKYIPTCAAQTDIVLCVRGSKGFCVLYFSIQHLIGQIKYNYAEHLGKYRSVYSRELVEECYVTQVQPYKSVLRLETDCISTNWSSDHKSNMWILTNSLITVVWVLEKIVPWKMTRKNNIYHLKHHFCLCVWEIQHSGACLKANTALGFTLWCISHPLVLYYSYTHSSALTTTYKPPAKVTCTYFTTVWLDTVDIRFLFKTSIYSIVNYTWQSIYLILSVLRHLHRLLIGVN